MKNLPRPSINRLCDLYRLLKKQSQEGQTRISSSKISQRLGVGAHNIRKDISYLGDIGNSGGGYNVEHLKSILSQKLGLDKERLVCIVGLGQLGTALLNVLQNHENGFRVIAGFDSNVNKIETLRTSADVFPSYNMTEIIQRMNIELAVLTVPTEAAQDVTVKLVNAGIKGIVNFTQALIQPPSPQVFVRNIDLFGEFTILTALMTVNKE